MPHHQKNNRELLEFIITEIGSLKTAIAEIRFEISKINQIEYKLKRGEVSATTNGGWFTWS